MAARSWRDHPENLQDIAFAARGMKSTLEPLADVRALIEKHLPKDRRERSTWRHVASCGAETSNVAIALRMALMLEGVACRST